VRTKTKHEKDAEGQNACDRDAKGDLRPALLPLSVHQLKPGSNGARHSHLFSPEDLNLWNGAQMFGKVSCRVPNL
jgi:hypothetical protein